MDYFLGSIKLMLIVYALAAVISLGVAWIIRCIFACIKMRKVKTHAALKHTAGAAQTSGPAGRA